MTDDSATHDERDETHFWIACPGCTFDGKVGLPHNYPADVVVCPKCRQVIRVCPQDRVLWQPADALEFFRGRFPGVDCDAIEAMTTSDAEEAERSGSSPDGGQPQPADEPSSSVCPVSDRRHRPPVANNACRACFIAASVIFIALLAYLVGRGAPSVRLTPAADGDRQAAPDREARRTRSNAPRNSQPKTAPKKPAPPAKRSDPAAPRPAAVESVQVAFTGAAGMTIRRTAQAGAASEPLVVPGNMDFAPGAVHCLMLTDVPGHEGVELLSTLEVRPTSPRTRAYLAQRTVALDFDDDDYEQVLDGKLVVKVVYLPRDDEDGVAQTLANTQGAAVGEVERRGDVIAVLRVGNRDARMPPIKEMLARAKDRLQARDFIAATRGFSDCIRVEPDAALGYQYRAMAHECQGNLDRAIDDLTEAIRREPGRSILFQSRSRVYEAAGQFDVAVADVAHAIELAEEWQHRTARAEVSFLRGRLRELLEVLYAQTAGLIRQERYVEAIEDLTLILRLRPDAPTVYLRRAVAYDKKGDDEAALADYNRALKLKPGPAEAFRWRSQIHERKRNFAAALADMRMAQWLSPGAAEYVERILRLQRQQAYQHSPQLAGASQRSP